MERANDKSKNGKSHQKVTKNRNNTGGGDGSGVDSSLRDIFNTIYQISTSENFVILTSFAAFSVIGANRLLVIIENENLLGFIDMTNQEIMGSIETADNLSAINVLPDNIAILLESDDPADRHQAQMLYEKFIKQKVDVNKSKSKIIELQRSLIESNNKLRKLFLKHLAPGEQVQFTDDLNSNNFHAVIARIRAIYLRPDPNGAAIVGQLMESFRKDPSNSLDKHIRILVTMCYAKATLEGSDVIAEDRVIHLLIRSLKYTRFNDDAHALSANCHHYNTLELACNFLLNRERERMTERNFDLIIKLEYEQKHGGGGKGKSTEDKPRAESNNIERGNNNNNNKKGNNGGGGGKPAAKPTPAPRLNDAGQPMPSPKVNDGKCLNCQEPGHIGRFCPNPKRAPEHSLVESNMVLPANVSNGQVDVKSSNGPVTKHILDTLEKAVADAEPSS